MDRFETARALVLEAGARLRRAHPESGAVWEKTGHQDLVTRCDRETEQFLRGGILSAFSGDAIVGEEYPATPAGATGYIWYIDPIDGTTNFVSQRRNYAVSVGCYQDGVPAFGLVLDVARGALYSARPGRGALRDDIPIHTSPCASLRDALLTTPGILHTFLREHSRRAGLVTLAGTVRGVRSLGSVALELCAVAAGEAELFVALRSCPWDHNAARIILTEAGGCICALDGSPLPQDKGSTVLAACSRALLEQVLSGLEKSFPTGPTDAEADRQAAPLPPRARS